MQDRAQRSHQLRRAPLFFERSEGTLVYGSQEFQSTAFFIRSPARPAELNGLIGEAQGGMTIEDRRDLAQIHRQMVCNGRSSGHGQQRAELQLVTVLQGDDHGDFRDAEEQRANFAFPVWRTSQGPEDGIFRSGNGNYFAKLN